MKYFIVSGEASGDLHASNLIRAIQKIDSSSQFFAWAGDESQQAGATLLKHYKEMSFMGFWEVIQNLGTIRRNIETCKNDILNQNLDVLILIDFSGFNLRIAEWAKQKGLKIVYYISPQIWATRANRVHKIIANTDLVISILPFEKDFYKKYGYEIEYVGHPLLDVVENYRQKKQNLKKENHSKKKIALLPGSRKQEIATVLPIMLEVVAKNKDLDFIIAQAPAQDTRFYESIIPSKLDNVKLLKSKTYDLLASCDAALVTSGTATLEAALFNIPQVVCYKGNAISYAIAKRIIKVKFISLVNLIMDKEVVTELIQSDLTATKLNKELENLLHSSDAILENYQSLRHKLGNRGASDRAAQLICDMFLK